MADATEKIETARQGASGENRRMLGVVADSFKTASENKITWAAAIVIPVIIALFGLLYVATFHDPLGAMEELPVAVINLDEGCTVEGEQKNYGAQMMDSILEDESAGWVEEDPALVDEGLSNSDYYLAVIIPEDFSERISAGQVGTPEQAGVTFYKNERKNFMLATISSRIDSELEQTIGDEVSEEYARALAEGLESARDGFADAAEGAAALLDGSEELADALGDAADGGTALADGSGELVSGAEALEAGASQLSDGASEVGDGAARLQSQGTSLVASGLSQLSASIDALPDQAADLGAGASQVADGVASASAATAEDGELASGAAAVAAGMGSLKKGIDSAQEGATGLEQALLAAYAALSQSSDPACQAAAAQLQATGAVGLAQSQAVSLGLSQASGSVGDASTPGTLAFGAASVSAGIGELGAGLQTASEGAAQVAAGADAMAQGTGAVAEAVQALSDGATQVNANASTLAQGASSAASGASQLASQAPALTEGARQVEQGASQLASGLDEARDGGEELASGAGELSGALADGAAEIGESLTASAGEYASYIAQPVAVEDEIYGEFTDFGDGFAPFFMTVCLWLGALLTFFVFEAFPSRACLNAGRFAAVFGRWPLYACMMALELAFLLGGALLVGVPCTNAAAFVMLAACIAFAFMCIMQFFNLFDVVGKAVSILVLVFQIAFCSGTFPIELGSTLGQSVAPFLPFTYAIDAYREVMVGGDMAVVLHDAGMLLAFAVGAVALSLIVYPLALKAKRNRDAACVRAITGAEPSELCAA